MRSRFDRMGSGAFLTMAIVVILATLVPISTALADDGPPPSDSGDVVLAVALVGAAALTVAIAFLLRAGRLGR